VSGNFSHAKPKILQDSEEKEFTDILSFSHQAYSIRTDKHIDAADYYAATEIGAKFKSRAAVYDYFGAELDEEEATCREINERALRLVQMKIPSRML